MAPRDSLYQRLGGVDTIAVLVDEFIDRITRDPRLSVQEAPRLAGFRFVMTEMICSAAGRPPEDADRSIAELHNRLRQWTNQEWDAVQDDFHQALQNFNLPLSEQHELKSFFNMVRSNHKPTPEKPDEHQGVVQQIVEALPSIIYVLDIRQKKLVFHNSSTATAPDPYDPEFVRSIIHPDDWQRVHDYLERLAKLDDQETMDFEYRARDKGNGWRWFHRRDRVFKRDADGSVREIIGTATDATERRASDERAQFMADLNQTIAPIADPEQIMAVVVRMLGEYLGVDRCGYAEVETDEDQFVVMGNYTRGDMPNIVGRYRISDFGERERQVLRENHPYVVNDIEAESPPGTDLSLYEYGAIRSMVCVPLIKQGHLVARMAVHQRTPRTWSQSEIELLSKVAHRCWESVERARALRRLKESEDRYRAFIANSSEAIWRYELDQPIPIDLPTDEQIEMLFMHAYLAECNDAMARMYGYDSADQIVGARLRGLLVTSDPQNIAYLRAFKNAGYRLADFESREVDRYGNTKYFLNNLTAVQENGAIVRGWGTQRDITEQKRAEEALRGSEERLRRITDATQDALWEIDLKTRQLWWSEGARPLFGHSPGELEIGLEDWYNGIHPDDVARVRSRFEQFMTGDSWNWADEYRFRCANGNYMHIFDQGRKFQDESGAVRIAGAMVDITKRKMAEAAGRESEERYRLLTELSPEGVVIAGSDGTIHLANPSMSKLLGVAMEQVMGRSLFEFLAPEYVDHCLDCMQTLMANDKPVTQIEAAFRNAHGTNVPVEVSAVRFVWKGQPFAQIVIHDISGRKQAETERQQWTDEIQAERDRLRQILEQMPIGIAIAEAPSGRLFFHNLEAERLLRHPMLPSDDFKGYVLYGGLHPDGTAYQAEEYPQARSLLSKEVVKGEEMRYRRGDGTETFFSLDSAPIYDPRGRMVLTVATFIDIAERKQAEKSMRESEERFAKAFRASPDSLVISRIADGVVLEVNDSFVSLSGYTRDEIVGKSTLRLGLYNDPVDRQRAVKMMKEQQHVRDHEFLMKLKSGETRLMSFSAEPLELRGEHCWLTIGRDISERKRIEEERERLLEQEKRAREEAEAANRMKDEFLATISHELRTPLTSILGWARILIDTPLSETQSRNALAVIERSAKSQSELIDNILDTSRIITGKLKLDAHQVEIEQVFQAAVDVIRLSAQAKRIDLRVAIDDHGSMVVADANRLQQAIWNLLANAVKFTNQDGIVEARLMRDGDQIEITVRDTGIGIEPQFLPYVFDRFRQADSTSTRKYGGLGLGLAIVRLMVEMHGGTVTASSPGKGQGATFMIRLPVASPKGLAQLTSEPAVSTPLETSDSAGTTTPLELAGQCVLVVEDDPDTLDMLRFMLDTSGATVVTAASAKEALEVLERCLPNALISDIAMPGQDGYDLIAKVRRRGPDRGGNIPAVALTAQTRAEDRERALAAGFQRHVSKPVDPEELVAVVANLLS